MVIIPTRIGRLYIVRGSNSIRSGVVYKPTIKKVLKQILINSADLLFLIRNLKRIKLMIQRGNEKVNPTTG